MAPARVTLRRRLAVHAPTDGRSRAAEWNDRSELLRPRVTRLLHRHSVDARRSGRSRAAVSLRVRRHPPRASGRTAERRRRPARVCPARAGGRDRICSRALRPGRRVSARTGSVEFPRLRSTCLRARWTLHARRISIRPSIPPSNSRRLRDSARCWATDGSTRADRSRRDTWRSTSFGRSETSAASRRYRWVP